MNLNMIKKVDVNNTRELKEALNSFYGPEMIGPLKLSNNIYEISTQFEEGGNSLLAYLSTCEIVLSSFVAMDISARSNELTFDDYVKVIVDTLKELENDSPSFAYMYDLKKWLKLIFNELNSENKAKFYAFDKVISEQIDSEHFIPLSKYIGDEDHKTNVLFKTYYSFLKSKIKNQ